MASLIVLAGWLICAHASVFVRLCVFTSTPGDGNATVEVAMFSAEIPAPMGLVHPVDVWIEDGYTKKDRVIK